MMPGVVCKFLNSLFRLDLVPTRAIISESRKPIFDNDQFTKDCPDCEDSQFCHSSRVSHPQLQLGIPGYLILSTNVSDVPEDSRGNRLENLLASDKAGASLPEKEKGFFCVCKTGSVGSPWVSVDWDAGCHGWRQMLRCRCFRTELITPDLICPSTYQLLWNSGGDSGPDLSFDKSASLERLFSSARVSLAEASLSQIYPSDVPGCIWDYVCETVVRFGDDVTSNLQKHLNKPHGKSVTQLKSSLKGCLGKDEFVKSVVAYQKKLGGSTKVPQSLRLYTLEDHIFALCPFSRNIWDLIRKWWGLDVIPLDTALNVLEMADDGDLNFGEKISSLFDVVVLCAIWWIWKAQNLLVFQAVKVNMINIIDDIIATSYLWIKNKAKSMEVKSIYEVAFKSSCFRNWGYNLGLEVAV
ncbi:hypothetical protein Tco_0940371 [Tanacetum coccineum]|uniref:Uncharacterized protein n=1 Tax=Tanacetum coccineum TaxID=301880 RepID=A0ABQ5DMT8_9ASTR